MQRRRSTKENNDSPTESPVRWRGKGQPGKKQLQQQRPRAAEDDKKLAAIRPALEKISEQPAGAIPMRLVAQLEQAAAGSSSNDHHVHNYRTRKTQGVPTAAPLRYRTVLIGKVPEEEPTNSTGQPAASEISQPHTSSPILQHQQQPASAVPSSHNALHYGDKIGRAHV